MLVSPLRTECTTWKPTPTFDGPTAPTRMLTNEIPERPATRDKFAPGAHGRVALKLPHAAGTRLVLTEIMSACSCRRRH